MGVQCGHVGQGVVSVATSVRVVRLVWLIGMVSVAMVVKVVIL